MPGSYLTIATWSGLLGRFAARRRRSGLRPETPTMGLTVGWVTGHTIAQHNVQMPRHFQKKPDAEKRSVPMLVRWTPDEAQRVRHSAGIRQLDVAEFIRRAALGRKANVDRETEAVLALSAITREVRALHAAMVERGITPPEGDLLPVILEARQAILRIAEIK